MNQQLSSECKTLVQRLKECNLEDICKNPSLMIKFYPIRDPDNELTIFDEVYSLINESLLTKSYRSRIFYFLNVFLSSTKVPAYIIAAYIKRLSRLTLDAKPRTLVTILRLVGNLFIRHPTLLVLRDRVDDKAREIELISSTCTLRSWLEDDPFDVNENRNLKLTNAMESSVWELMPLRYHRHPKVVEAASYLSESSLPEMEFDLDDMLK